MRAYRLASVFSSKLFGSLEGQTQASLTVALQAILGDAFRCEKEPDGELLEPEKLSERLAESEVDLAEGRLSFTIEISADIQEAGLELEVSGPQGTAEEPSSLRERQLQNPFASCRLSPAFPAGTASTSCRQCC